MLIITFDDFVTLLTEVYVRVVADNVSTPQCVDLAQLWNRILGGSPFTGDAHTIYSQAGTIYTQVPNTPDGVPTKGAIIVWSPAFNGGPGHVAVSTGEGDVNTFKALEQNDTTGGTDSSVQVKEYDYTDVMGWLVPNQQPENQQEIIDKLRTDRDANWNLYQTTLQQLTDCQNSKVVTPTSTEVTVPATTSNGTTNVTITVPSTEGTSSANTINQTESPSVTVQTTTQTQPKKLQFTLGDRIVWILLNIKYFLIGK